MSSPPISTPPNAPLTALRRSLCLPLQCATYKELIQQIERNSSRYAYFEVWLGALQQELSPEEFSALLSSYGKRLVILLRKKELILGIKGARAISYLDTLAHSPGGSEVFIDLDYRVQSEEIAYLQKKKYSLKTIYSFHDYEKTPSAPELEALVTTLRALSPTAIKISTFCTSPQDALRLLSKSYALQEQQIPHIVLGMGLHGLPTRILGPLSGNILTFAPLSLSSSSAPGQLKLDDIESIYAHLPQEYFSK